MRHVADPVLYVLDDDRLIEFAREGLDDFQQCRSGTEGEVDWIG